MRASRTTNCAIDELLWRSVTCTPGGRRSLIHTQSSTGTLPIYTRRGMESTWLTLAHLHPSQIWMPSVVVAFNGITPHADSAHKCQTHRKHAPTWHAVPASVQLQRPTSFAVGYGHYSKPLHIVFRGIATGLRAPRCVQTTRLGLLL